MTSHFKTAILSISLALASLPGPAYAADQVKPAPIPAQILAAKRIFIANAGGDQMAPDDPIFSGGPDRAYNQFYAAMKDWGRFEIVGSPAEADLLIEVRQEVLMIVLGGKAGSSATPTFGLKIRDAKTNALLWGFHVHGVFGLGQGNSDRNFDQAVDRLAMDLRMLVAPLQPPASGTSRP
jgi:hypothetical protein